MTRHVVNAGAVLYAMVDLAVIVAPALVLAAAADKGGLPGSHGVDLLVASTLIGAAHAAVAFVRLTSEARWARRRVDIWIAGFDALVVLALGVTLLLVVVLGGLADEHAVLVNEGWPVVWLWVGVQLAAVTLAELVGWLVFRWLEPSRPAAKGGHPAE